VVNTTAEELADMAIEISVWDLDGTSSYYKVSEKIVVPPKKVKQIMKMKYQEMKNAKPVYFLLLKLFRLSDNEILSRNFYWLHLHGQDYKLLEQYQQKRIPLKIVSEVSVSGTRHEVRMTVENKSRKSVAESTQLMDPIVGYSSCGSGKESKAERHESGGGLWRKLRSGLSIARSDDSLRAVEVNGTDSGVAFFLHFSVHTTEASTHEKYRDTRILPVHYSDNYFSIVPGEKTVVDISFEAPQGSSPRIVLKGWNHHLNHAVMI
jgi:mannosylglycoprotein endo-beta-mannosidase